MVTNVHTPGVFVLADTRLDPNMGKFLKYIGAPSDWNTDAHSDIEYLTEVAGRACYRSFGTEMNLNVKKVREGNNNYLGSILNTGHGSVLEHGSITFAFVDVSRVFTHELVRHRVGAAYSQESLRFVRLSDLRVVWPSDGLGDAVYERCNQLGRSGEETRQVLADIAQVWERTMDECSEAYKFIGNVLELDDCTDFGLKKRCTSAMRRLAPIGLATMIIATYNIRSLRHIIAMRTAPGAEEEVRKVFNTVGQLCRVRYPALFQDMNWNETDGGWVFDNWKV
jgi:thymidylate synthase (FAD)